MPIEKGKSTSKDGLKGGRDKSVSDRKIMILSLFIFAIMILIITVISNPSFHYSYRSLLNMLLEENSSVNETVNETSAIILEKPINVSDSSSYSQESNASNNESHDLIDNESNVLSDNKFNDLIDNESHAYLGNESNVLSDNKFNDLIDDNESHAYLGNESNVLDDNESHDLIDNESYDLNDNESPSYSVNESNNTPENILENTRHNISENVIGDIPQDSIQNMTDELDKLEEQPEKVKDDKEFDVIVKSSYMKGDDLVIIFYHNSKYLQPIRIDGDVNYSLNKNESRRDEPVKLTIYNWHDDYFRMIVGRHSEVLQFGKRRRFNLKTEIRDSKGKSLNAEIKFIDPILNKTELKYNTGHRSRNIEEGRYRVELRTTEKHNPVKKIIFNDVDVRTDLNLAVNIDDVEEDKHDEFSQFVEVYAIDPTGFNFTNATVTVIASGTELYKCKDWDFDKQACNGDWELFKTGLVPCEEYNFTLTPEDPGFAEGVYSVDVALTPINESTFIIAFINDSSGDLKFDVMDTNGSILVGPIKVDTVETTKSRVSLTPINSTHFVIGWIDGQDNDVRAAVYKTNGANIVSSFTVDSNVRNNGDVSVAEISNGDRFVVCYANDDDNDADFKIYYNNGTQAVGESRVDGNMNPDKKLQNYVECSGINSSRWVYMWYDDASDDATFSTLNLSGDDILSKVDLDKNIGNDGQVAVTTLDDDKFAVVWFDSSDKDITISVKYVNGTDILSPTDIDTNVNNRARVAIGTIDNPDGNGDMFVVAWYTKQTQDIRAAVYYGNGTEYTSPFTVENNPKQEALLDVMGKYPLTNISICKGKFIIAYTNSSDDSIFKGYYINGTEWDGICGDKIPPIINYVVPTDNDGIIVGRNWTYINVTVNENASVCLLEWSGINETMSGSGQNWYKNKTDSDGIYTYRVYCNDTSGNMNKTNQRSITFDTTPPNITFVSPTDCNITITRNWTYINVTLNETPDWLRLEWNGSNETMSGSGQNWYKNMTNLANGNYTFKVWANDSMGNMGHSSVCWVYVKPLKIEWGFLNVGSNWVTVNLKNEYQEPVIVASVDYSNNTHSIVPRITNVSSNSFKIRLLNPSGNAINYEKVYYIAVEEGAGILPDGNKYEAYKYITSKTAYKTNWVGDTKSYIQSYANPVVVASVMSNNDSEWQTVVAWGSSRNNPPDSSHLVLSRHVGEDTNKNRNDETIGYIVFDTKHGNINGISYEARVGSDTVRGIDNSPPFYYTFTSVFSSTPKVGIVTLAGLDGGDGGWAQLHGNSPLSTTQIGLSISEDQMGDSERSHTTEQVGYIVFERNGSYDSSDTTPPKITFVSPTDCNITITRNWTYINVTLNETPDWLRLEWNGSNETMSGSGQNWYKNMTNLANGNYTFKVWANDSMGNMGHSSVCWVNISYTPPDTTPPIVHLVNPVNQTMTSNPSQTFTCNITDDSTISNLTLFIWNSTEGNIYTNTKSLSGTSNQTSWSYSLPYDDVFKWNCKGYDNSGNNNWSKEDNYTITLDTNSPSINFVPPTTSSGNHSQSYILCNVSASDAHLDSIIIYLYNTSGLKYSHTCSSSPCYYNFSGLPDGTYYLNSSANDSLSHTNSTPTREIHLDTLGPVITYVSPSDIDGSLVDRSWSYVNVTLDESSSSCFLSWDGINESMSGSGQNWYKNKSDSDGLHSYSVYCNDSLGNPGHSSSRNITFDTASPSINFVPPTTSSGNHSQSYILCNVTASDAHLDSIIINLYNTSGLKYSHTCSSSPCYYNFSGLPDGTYYLNSSANDSLSHTNSTPTREIHLDTIPPAWDQTPQNQTITYGQSFSYDLNASDPSGIDIYWVNDTSNFAMNGSTGELKNNTLLAAGLYWLNISVNDTFGNILSSVIFVNVTQGVTGLTLISSPSWSVVYPSQTNVSCVANNSEVTVHLYRNGSSVSNPDVQTLGVGHYQYTCNTSGSQNYSSASVTNQLNISRRSSSDEEEKSEFDVTLNYTCAGQSLTTTVIDHDTDDPVQNAHVMLSYLISNYYRKINEGYTDSHGTLELIIPFETEYKLSVTKEGYDSYKKIFNISCTEECLSDSDCHPDYICLNHTCSPISCDCGYIENHTCIDYDCCSDSDCSDDEYCVNHSCIQLNCSCGYIENHTCIGYDCCSDSDCSDDEYCFNHSCIQLNCSCGYIENHSCINYACCSDSDCDENEECINHECVLRKVDIKANYSDNHLIVNAVYDDGYPVANYHIKVRTKSGKILSAITDTNGRAEIYLSGEVPMELLAPGKILNISDISPSSQKIENCEMLGIDYGRHYNLCWYSWVIIGIIVFGVSLSVIMKLRITSKSAKK